MKKLSAVLVSASMAVCGMTALASSAASSGYSPVLYIEADEGENFEKLPSGKLYINTSKVQSDEISLSGRVYIDDERNNAGIVFVKWQSKNSKIKLTDFVNPFDIAGAATYAEYDDPDQIAWSHNKEENFIGVSYVCATKDENDKMETLTFKGQSSKDYPLGGFKASVDTSISAGEYTIDFMNEKTQMCNILYRLDGNNIEEVFPSGYYAKGLKIGVSDRMLGDVDGTGKYEAYDASLVLNAYAALAANKDTGLTDAQLVAADVDGDGIVTAADAGIILTYYAYLSGNGELSLIDFQKQLG